MAVKVQRKTQDVVPDASRIAETLKIVVLKHVTRFDAIETYAKAIHTKLDEALRDVLNGADANAVMLHLKTVRQLAQDITNQVEEATKTDLQE